MVANILLRNVVKNFLNSSSFFKLVLQHFVSKYFRNISVFLCYEIQLLLALGRIVPVFWKIEIFTPIYIHLSINTKFSRFYFRYVKFPTEDAKTC